MDVGRKTRVFNQNVGVDRPRTEARGRNVFPSTYFSKRSPFKSRVITFYYSFPFVLLTALFKVKTKKKKKDDLVT